MSERARNLARRALWRVVLALVLGAVTTVGVAWSTNFWGRNVMRLSASGVVIETEVEGLWYYLQGEAGAGRSSRYGHATPSPSPNQLSLSWRDVLSITEDPGDLPHGWERWTELDIRSQPVRLPRFLEVDSHVPLRYDNPLDLIPYGFSESARGWPMLALKQSGRFSLAEREWIARGGLRFDRTLRRGGDIEFPMTPIPLGFAADTFLYAMIWMGLVSAPGVVRLRRVRRGRCPRCAYDLAGDLASGCPECGWGRVRGDGDE